MLITLIAVAVGLACLSLGVLLGLGTAYLLAETLLKIYDTLENPDPSSDEADTEPVYDWDASITAGDGVVRVPIYRDTHGADGEAVLELHLDDAHSLGQMLIDAEEDTKDGTDGAAD